jgi:hypothetical protein
MCNPEYTAFSAIQEQGFFPGSENDTINLPQSEPHEP